VYDPGFGGSCLFCVGQIFFIGEITSNFDLESMILIWCCVFSMENMS
jgi:hypothetical protein